MGTQAQSVAELQKEVDILVYQLGPYAFGMNLSKVRELVRFRNSIPVPYSDPIVSGVFELRKHSLPLIDMRRWVSLENVYPEGTKIIIAQFLGTSLGLKVDRVERIYRIPWKDIASPELIRPFSSIILGTIKLGDRLVNLLDYEAMTLGLSPRLMRSLNPGLENDELLGSRQTKRLWIIDDSPAIQEMTSQSLRLAGYQDIQTFPHPGQPLELLQKTQTAPTDLIISDIEMPFMDGYTFTHQAKSIGSSRNIPILLFSSLLDPENRLRGELHMADAQLSKSQAGDLVALVDRLLFSRNLL